MVRIGIAGCGHAARIHAGRLAGLEGVQIVGCADTERAAAEALARTLPTDAAGATVPAFTDPRELLTQQAPGVLAIFTPHRSHYRLALDALQAGCHVFIEKPLSTNAQEAADIVNLARARGLKVAVGHQFRLVPSLIAARQRLAAGAIGPLRLVSAVMAAPWLSRHSGPEDSWRLDPKAGGTGILADAGDHLLDALLWTTGHPATVVAAIQARTEGGLDVVTAAALRLGPEIPATLGVSGVAAAEAFEIRYFGERGELRATPETLVESIAGAAPVAVTLPPAGPSIDADFIDAIRSDRPPCCPADAAIDTVRLLEAITRSAASQQVVRVG